MLILGHRGAMGYAPENTITSFKKAIEQGCDGFELDVQLTKDNCLVVIHDWDVSRTTNGKGLVSGLAMDYIRGLDAGSKVFDGRFAGERIPTLEEVLDIMPESMVLNIEIKCKADDVRDIEEKVISLLEQKNRVKNTIISSFNHDVLKRVRNISKDVKIALLFTAYLCNPLEYLKINGLDIYSYHPKIDYVTPDLVRTLHHAGIKVYPWIVNDEAGLKKCLDYGADGFTTDYPDVLRDLLKANMK